MPDLHVHNLDEATLDQLRAQVEVHGRSLATPPHEGGVRRRGSHQCADLQPVRVAQRAPAVLVYLNVHDGAIKL